MTGAKLTSSGYSHNTAYRDHKYNIESLLSDIYGMEPFGLIPFNKLERWASVMYIRMVRVWFGNVNLFKKVEFLEFPTAIIHVVSEKICKKPDGSTIRPSCPWLGRLLLYRFCYVVFNSHMFNSSEVQLCKWCFNIKFVLFLRPIHVWRSRTPVGVRCAHFPIVLSQQWSIRKFSC
jgi:hypothetical protein